MEALKWSCKEFEQQIHLSTVNFLSSQGGKTTFIFLKVLVGKSMELYITINNYTFYITYYAASCPAQSCSDKRDKTGQETLPHICMANKKDIINNRTKQ